MLASTDFIWMVLENPRVGMDPKVGSWAWP